MFLNNLAAFLQVLSVFWLTASGCLQFCVLQYFQVGPYRWSLEPVCEGADELCHKHAHHLQGRSHSHHGSLHRPPMCTHYILNQGCTFPCEHFTHTEFDWINNMSRSWKYSNTMSCKDVLLTSLWSQRMWRNLVFSSRPLSPLNSDQPSLCESLAYVNTTGIPQRRLWNEAHVELNPQYQVQHGADWSCHQRASPT